MITAPKKGKMKEKAAIHEERLVNLEKKLDDAIESIVKIQEEIKNIGASKADVIIKDNGPFIGGEAKVDTIIPIDSITPEILQEVSEEDLTTEALAEPENLKVKDIKTEAQNE